MKSVKYRKEPDGKFHADIDGTGRFGTQFSSISEMRAAIKEEYALEEVSYKLFKFDLAHSRLSTSYPQWRIMIHEDGTETAKTGWNYGYLVSALPYLSDY